MEEKILKSEKEMREWAGKLAEDFEEGQVVLLKGELGAGKTIWVRGVLEGLKSENKAKSPTYTILREYESERGKILHLDLYRLSGWEEVLGLGWPEMIDDFELVFVEWPERLEGNLPDGALELDFEVLGEDVRKVVIGGNFG